MDWLKTEEALKVCECLISGKVKYGFNPFEMNYLFMALGNIKMMNEIDNKKVIENAVRVAHQKVSQVVDNSVSFYANLAILTTLASTIPNSLEIFERQFKDGIKSLKETPEILGIDEEVRKVINVDSLIDQQAESYLNCVNILRTQVNEALKKNNGGK